VPHGEEEQAESYVGDSPWREPGLVAAWLEKTQQDGVMDTRAQRKQS
jgi:hypothetical protein